MDFIIKPAEVETQDRGCNKFITLCGQCSENPIFCYEL